MVASRVVVLYDADYIKKFRVYFTAPGQTVKFEHGMRNFTGRARVAPDVVHIVTIAPEDYDGSTVLAPVALNGAASRTAGVGIWGYDTEFLWLVNPNVNWPTAEVRPVVTEVTCRWFHSHERFGDGIDGLDETRERPVL